MSGGSYEYLCHADPEQLMGYAEVIGKMATRLREMGCHDEAQRTRGVAEHLQAAKAGAARLQGVWHAVEWLDSGDWSEDRARAEIQNYASVQAFGTLDGESFVACECDRTEDARLEGVCIADGEVERLRASGWVYDGVTWVCPEHAKNIIAMVTNDE